MLLRGYTVLLISKALPALLFAVHNTVLDKRLARTPRFPSISILSSSLRYKHQHHVFRTQEGLERDPEEVT